MTATVAAARAEEQAPCATNCWLEVAVPAGKMALSEVEVGGDGRCLGEGERDR